MDESLSEDLRELLVRFHASEVPLDALRTALRGVAVPEDLHRILQPVGVPQGDVSERVPSEDTVAYGALRAVGEAAIARGELAVVVLAGGMATRFGGVVKALVPLSMEGTTRFIDGKLADVDMARRLGPVDVTLMTSFATHDVLARALGDIGRTDVHLAPQFVSLRLTPTGALFRTRDGKVSPYAPGHGDLPRALAVHGALQRLRAAGVRTVLMSNVDNIGATVDPVLYGMHKASGARISVELVEKHPGDRGGLPVEIGGRLVLAEAFRLGEDARADGFPLFNTNTLWMDLEVLEAPAPWTWCAARKTLEGLEAVQMERLVGELTWWHATHWVHVPRDGGASRFIPVKEPGDLVRQRGQIAEVLSLRVKL